MKKFSSLFLLSTLFSSVIIAQSGTLDATFGVNGIVTTDVGTNSYDLLHSIAIQPDQKIIAIGNSNAGGASWDFVIARYLPDGTPDPEFGSNGIARIDFNSAYDNGHAILVLADGHILVGGEASINGVSDFGLARLNSDGSIDSTFGVNGKVQTDLGAEIEYINALAYQPDGKIIAAGKIIDGDFSMADFAMVRYTANGDMDATFGNNGVVRTSVQQEDEATGIVLQPDGKIILGGFASINAKGDFAMVRYLVNGEVDKSFGIGGKTITDLEGTGKSDLESCMLLDKDGNIILAGSANFDPFFGESDFGVVRYDSDGHLDPSFGIGGIYILHLGNYSQLEAIVQQSDGKYILGGKSNVIGFKNQWCITRILNEGGLDTLFGNHGIAVTDMAGDDEVVTDMVIQKDTRIVAGGIGLDPEYDFNLARYIADFVITADISGILCPGEENAEIAMQVSGGVEPFSYSLDAINFTANGVFSGLAAGIYYVTVKDANGVIATYGPVQIEDVIVPPVDVNVTGNIVTVTVDGGVAPFLYSIDGGTIFQAINVFTDVPDGAYQLIVVDGNGCVIYDGTVLVLATGVKDIEELSFSISPNPTRDFISIELESKSTTLKAVIVDMTGRMISSKELIAEGKGKFTFRVDQWMNGQYQLWIKDGNEWGSSSFIVSK